MARMRVLIVKMSSMGDVIHTLPAITDAVNAYPDITFDWVVESAFRDIPRWHPAVKNIFPIQLRKWRKNIFYSLKSPEYKAFKSALRANTYDLIIDAQGLLKSAVVAKLARGPIAGLHFSSAREKWASFFYQKKIHVKKNQHAITRVRQLLAQALQYTIPTNEIDYGLAKNVLPKKPLSINTPYFVFLHSTTWATKHYPESYWKKLIALFPTKTILLPWGNEKEKARAERLAAAQPNAIVLPQCSIAEIASLLADAEKVVAVDTGLGHLSAALNTPTLSLYSPTNPLEVGTKGKNQLHLQTQYACAPCKLRKCTFKKSEEEAIYPPCFISLPPEKIQQWLGVTHE